METALFCSLGASPSGARRAGGKAKLLRHLELEVMALGAVVLALLVPHVAVRAVKIRAVVRGVMRVRRFHVFRRRDELILRVAGGAGRGQAVVVVPGSVQVAVVGIVSFVLWHATHFMPCAVWKSAMPFAAAGPDARARLTAKAAAKAIKAFILGIFYLSQGYAAGPLRKSGRPRRDGNVASKSPGHREREQCPGPRRDYLAAC